MQSKNLMYQFQNNQKIIPSLSKLILYISCLDYSKRLSLCGINYMKLQFHRFESLTQLSSLTKKLSVGGITSTQAWAIQDQVKKLFQSVHVIEGHILLRQESYTCLHRDVHCSCPSAISLFVTSFQICLDSLQSIISKTETSAPQPQALCKRDMLSFIQTNQRGFPFCLFLLHVKQRPIYHFL